MSGPEFNPRDDESFDQKEYEKWAAEQDIVFRGICAEIRAEREAQDAEWGGHTHDDKHTQFEWWTFIKQHSRRSIRGRKTDSYRKQMIRVAALAIAAIQAFDRKKKTE